MGYVGCDVRVPCSLIGQLCVARPCCVLTVLRVAHCTENVAVHSCGGVANAFERRERKQNQSIIFKQTMVSKRSYFSKGRVRKQPIPTRTVDTMTQLFAKGGPGFHLQPCQHGRARSRLFPGGICAQNRGQRLLFEGELWLWKLASRVAPHEPEHIVST
jgi:hypothetical protein